MSPQPPPRSWKPALIAGAITAVLCANVYLFIQQDRLRADMTKMRESLLTEIAGLKDTSSVTLEANRRHLTMLRDQLDTTRRQATMAASQAKSEALTHAEKLAKQLEQDQQQKAQQLGSQISEARDAATTANAKIADVSGDVNNVKSQVATTKSDLEKTIADLKKVTGDLGVTSGYVATNQKELAALKRLGERNYFEFNLSRTKAPQKVGDISLLLKKTDPKRNKYTLNVMADDRLTEKKDRTVNEPIQFYVSKAKQPYEIVVNQVKKDQIVGYLATPKEQVARN